jgi:hypothetical protein
VRLADADARGRECDSGCEMEEEEECISRFMGALKRAGAALERVYASIASDGVNGLW